MTLLNKLIEEHIITLNKDIKIVDKKLEDIIKKAKVLDSHRYQCVEDRQYFINTLKEST